MYKKVNAEGVLCLHLKRLFNFSTSFKIYNLKNFKVRIRYKNQIKESKIIVLSRNLMNKNHLIDELKIFSINISHEETNDLVQLELIQVNTDSEIVKSNFSLNVFELIRSNLVFSNHLTQFVRTRAKNTVSLSEPSCICSIEFDSCFLYGLFGYGLSNRIIFESDSNQAQSTKYHAYSLFKRVEEGQDSSEMNFSTFSADLENNTKDFPLLKKILEKRSNFLEYKSDLKQLKNRNDKLKYLKSLICE